jgi:hypothetical protein
MRRWAWIETASLTPRLRSYSSGFPDLGSFAQRFSSMGRHIGKNQVGGFASHKHSGRYFVHRRLANQFEGREKSSHATEMVISQIENVSGDAHDSYLESCKHITSITPLTCTNGQGASFLGKKLPRLC